MAANSSVLLIFKKVCPAFIAQEMTWEVLLANHVGILVAEASELREAFLRRSANMIIMCAPAIIGRGNAHGSHACDAEANNHWQEK
jgi:hypothetical protein